VRSDRLRIKPADGEGGSRGDGVLVDAPRLGVGAERRIAGAAVISSMCSMNLDVLRLSCI
jgi:hypothetical protein